MVESSLSVGGRAGWRTWAFGAGALAALVAQAELLRARPVVARTDEVAALAARLDRLEAKTEALATAPAPVEAGEGRLVAAQALPLEDRLAQLEHRLAQLDEVDDWNEAVRLGVARALATRASGMSGKQVAHLAALIVREARANRIDPVLVAAVMQVESGYNPYAVSNVGAVGLMQLMPATAGWLAEGADARAAGHLFDIDRNVALGCRYLASLIQRFGNVDKALVAYNMGPAAAAKALTGPRARALLDGYPKLVAKAKARITQPPTGPAEAQVVAAVAKVEGQARAVR